VRLSQALSALRADVEALERRAAPPAPRPSVPEFAEQLGLHLDAWQRDVLVTPSKRVLLNVTRQGGKSTVAAILGLYEALHRPGSLTLIVSPSDRQSGELFRKLVALRNRLPQDFELIEDTKRSMSVRDGGRVASLPGSEATIRGFSAATLIVEDEAARVDDELYLSVRPMLATTGGRLLLMSTPFGKRGHFWKEWSDGGGWHRVQVPATSIPRISAEFLEDERVSLGDWWFRQEYLTEFVQAEDSFFRDDDVIAALNPDVRPLFGGGS
jgi:hypothetical protein